MAATKPRWILFDLGGVLVRIGGVEDTIRQRRGGARAEDPWEDWLTSPSVQDWETGRIPSEEFAARLVAELDLDTTAEDFLADCKTWVLGTYEGVPDLLDQLRPHFSLACLSNTNPLHWPVMGQDLGLEESLDRCFLSYQLGMAKPDREIFEHIASELGCGLQEILFVDDNRLNVEGARAAGLQAEQARGADELRAVLTERGLLPALR